MSDEKQTPVAEASSNGGQPSSEPAAIAVEIPPVSSAGSFASPASDRPELTVGAAFAGGLALALLLKRLGR